MTNRLIIYCVTMLFLFPAFAGEKAPQSHESNQSHTEGPSLEPPALPQLPSRNQPTQHPAPTMSQDIDKYAWMSRMKNKLPSVLCYKNQYFMKCFNVQPQQCLNFTSIFLSACLDKAIDKIPSTLKVEDQKHWGQVMGHCTYDLYTTIMADLQKDLPECQTPSKTESTQGKKLKPSNKPPKTEQNNSNHE